MRQQTGNRQPFDKLRVSGPQTAHGEPQTAHGEPQTAHGEPQTAHGEPQTAHGEPQTAHGEPQTAHGEPQTAHGEPQTAHGEPVEPLTTPDSKGHVYFIGAGPGAADLITVRGRALIEAADVIIYADSLVDPQLCAYARPDAEVVGSSGLALEEIVERIISAARAGKMVARLHSGDPSIYGAIHEQMARLDAADVSWSIVPGVSSAFAAAALLGAELTVPQVSQTVILTRISGRASPVPSGEDLRSLAAHGTSLILFLSISHIARVVKELLAGGYAPDTPTAVVYRVTWPDEAVLRGTLGDIRAKVRAARWTKQALILVGPALAAGPDGYRSRLYAADYTHLFRKARKPARKTGGRDTSSGE